MLHSHYSLFNFRHKAFGQIWVAFDSLDQRLPDGADEAAENSIRQSGVGVLFLDGRGIERAPGGEQGRSGGVAADAQDDLRAKGAQEPPGLDHGDRHADEAQEPVDEAAALEARDGDGLQAIAQAGQDPTLDAVLGTDEGDRGLGVPGQDLLGRLRPRFR